MPTKNKFFFAIFAFFTVVSIFLITLNGKNYIFYFNQDFTDSYMDLYNSVIEEKYAEPGSQPGIYPPFSIVPYRILGKMAINFYQADSTKEMAAELRGSPVGSLILFLHIMGFMFPFALICALGLKGSVIEKILYTFAFCFSGILIWTLQRGNNIIYAFLFTILFVILYQKDDKVLKQISYVCLVLAVSIKLYPGIFGLILLEKKDWKGCAICICEFLALYVISFIICRYTFSFNENNFSNVAKWAGLTSQNASGLNLSIKNFIMILFGFVHKITKIPEDSLLPAQNIISKIVLIGMLSFGVFSYFFLKKYWQKMLVLSSLCMLVPSISWFYVMIFIFIPLYYFLNDEDQSVYSNFAGVTFGILVPIFIIPKLITKPTATEYGISLGFLIQEIVIFVLVLSVYFNAIKNFFTEKFNARK